MARTPTAYHQKTLERIARSLIASGNFRALVDLTGDALDADRCLLVLVVEATSELVVEAEYCGPNIMSLPGRRYPHPASPSVDNFSRTFGENVSVVIPVGSPATGYLLAAGAIEPEAALIFKKLSEDLAGLSDPQGFLTDNLSRQLNLERALRTFTMRVNATLDQNYILQTAVDSTGHMLKADLSLFARRGNPNSVTHEYIRSSLSPLGLGGTTHLSDELYERFSQQTATALARGVEPVDLDTARSWLGTPVVCGREFFGVLVAQDRETRVWKKQDVELIELIATAVSSALANALALDEQKDHLFNLKLATQLTSQLNSLIEQAGKIQGQPAKEPRISQALPLSNRELEVLRLIAGGLANREIAQRLFLTESTVELHASRIRKKLKLKSRTALVKFACDNGVV